jgi:hypothetical protein
LHGEAQPCVLLLIKKDKICLTTVVSNQKALFLQFSLPCYFRCACCRGGGITPIHFKMLEHSKNTLCAFWILCHHSMKNWFVWACPGFDSFQGNFVMQMVTFGSTGFPHIRYTIDCGLFGSFNQFLKELFGVWHMLQYLTANHHIIYIIIWIGPFHKIDLHLFDDWRFLDERCFLDFKSATPKFPP